MADYVILEPIVTFPVALEGKAKAQSAQPQLTLFKV
jgi:hypothetical protein